MKLFKWLISIYFLFGVISAPAAENTKQPFITQNQWQKHAKNYNYNENFKPEKKKEPKKKIQTTPKIKKPAFTDKYKTVIYVIVVSILCVLIYIIIRNIIKSSRDKIKIKGPLYNIHTIENINEIDLEQILSLHLRNKEFREALRAKYLILLRNLNSLKFITWKRDKSNGTYLNEMYGKTGYELFFKITLAFDRVWYGDKNIDEAHFNQICLLFDNFDQLFLTSEQ